MSAKTPRCRRSGAFRPGCHTEPQAQLLKNAAQCGESGIAVRREGLRQGLVAHPSPLGGFGETPRFDNGAQRDQQELVIPFFQTVLKRHEP